MTSPGTGGPSGRPSGRLRAVSLATSPCTQRTRCAWRRTRARSLRVRSRSAAHWRTAAYGQVPDAASGERSPAAGQREGKQRRADASAGSAVVPAGPHGLRDERAGTGQPAFRGQEEALLMALPADRRRCPRHRPDSAARGEEGGRLPSICRRPPAGADGDLGTTARSPSFHDEINGTGSDVVHYRGDPGPGVLRYEGLSVIQLEAQGDRLAYRVTVAEGSAGSVRSSGRAAATTRCAPPGRGVCPPCDDVDGSLRRIDLFLIGDDGHSGSPLLDDCIIVRESRRTGPSCGGPLHGSVRRSPHARGSTAPLGVLARTGLGDGRRARAGR